MAFWLWMFYASVSIGAKTGDERGEGLDSPCCDGLLVVSGVLRGLL